mmetsp:Transcript_56556/g.100812  ORF Transcript_56556/g.100812 Transcript_56556/m.100812 type:complete len:93 (-) Transcript_56556:2650-2928(-)
MCNVPQLTSTPGTVTVNSHLTASTTSPATQTNPLGQLAQQVDRFDWTTQSKTDRPPLPPQHTPSPFLQCIAPNFKVITVASLLGSYARSLVL